MTVIAPPELIAAFGLPGAFSAWGFAALNEMARHAFGSDALVSADDEEALIRIWADNPAQPILLTSHYPQPGLAAFVQQHASRRIVFIERTRAAVTRLAAAVPKPDIAIIRTVAASCACLASLPDRGDTIVFRDGVDTDAAIIARMAGWFDADVPCPPEFLVARSERSLATHRDDVEQGHHPDHLWAEMAETVLAPFDRHLDGRSDGFSWPHECFLSADDLGQHLLGRIDLTGPARCLVYGPYLHLPVGQWLARIVIGFGAGIHDQNLVVELHGGQPLGRLRIRAPAAPGRFAAELHFEVEQPHVALEMRLLTERGAIEGAIIRVDVGFSRCR